ncbi:MAG: stage V sporulation protein AC [Clostridia bacterium]|nr:stage V sporulation protein AC [Clostridia bacterium]
MTEDYKEYAKRHAPKSPLLKDTLSAFMCGGAVCAAGEGIKKLYMASGLSEEDASLMNSVTLIFIAVLLTGFGVFDSIARFAGAGVLLPITGFANAVASPAIDARTEGYVTGVGAKIFTVAGPVILYATSFGTLYGVIYYLVKLFS